MRILQDKRRRIAVAAVVAAVASASLLAFGTVSSGAGTDASTRSKATGGNVVYAVAFGQTWIFPIWNVGVGIANWDTLQSWLPLYWFGQNGKAQVNPVLSVGKLPVYSNGGKTVTITLNRGYTWTNGSPVTTRDIEFWINLLRASDVHYPQNWVGYSPTGFPFNVKSIKYLSPTKFQINFNRKYNDYWVLYNELSQIETVPQYAWDKTSESGPVGNYDRTPAGALKVLNFLNSRSKKLSAWTTDPLWQAVDGPFALKSYDASTGEQSFVRNTHYTGAGKPSIDSYTLKPFTSEQAEVSALLSGGGVDYGYLPLTDLKLAGRLKSMGYTTAPWPLFGFAQLPLNLKNPKVGPIFSQLYVRQAMARLIDQPTIVKAAFQGYAVPTYGPVPTAVPNPFASSFQKHNPYPYDPAAARKLLTQHGWQVAKGGVTTCARPGTGANECGKGIAAGAAMSFDFLYASGKPSVAQEAALLQTDFALAGVKLNLRAEPVGTLFATEVPCNPKTGANCKWEMIDTGQGWVYSSPQFAPTGEALFATGAGSNSYGYSDPTADKLIRNTETEPGLQAIFKYENYLAKQLPTLFLPWQVHQVSVISNKLHGALPQDPFEQFYPQYWSK